METFRQLIRGWLGKVLLVLFLIPFALVGIEGYFSGQGKEATAVKVDKTDISQTAVNTAVESQRKQLLEQVQGDESRLNNAAIQKSVVDSLISRAILLQQAKKLGFELNDEQVAQLVRQEPTFQENGQYSEKLFQTYLKNSGASLAQLLNEVREQVALRQLAGGVGETGIVTKTDINRLALIQTEKRSVQVASLPLSEFAGQVNVTNQQITDYFNKNSKKYVLPENVDLDYVELDNTALASQVQVSDADLQAQYQAMQAKSSGKEERHVQHILIEVNAKTPDATAKQQIEKIAARLKAGEDFGTVAKQTSQDAGSAANNGDLGLISKGSFLGAFDDTAFSLPVNQVSNPVRSDSGYHLIKVSEIKKEAVASFESLKTQLEVQARQAKLDELYSNTVNQLNDIAVGTDNMQDLAKTQKLIVNSLKGVSKSNATAPINNPAVKAALFNEDVVQGEHKVSTGIEIEPGKTIWVKVNAYHPARAKTLIEATPEIKQVLTQDALKAKAELKAQGIIQALQTKNPAQAQQENNIAFRDIGQVSRLSGAPIDLERKIFSLPKPKVNQWSAGTLVQGNNLLIVAVSSVEAGNADTLQEEQRQQLSSSLSSLRGQQDLADYVYYLKSKAKIKMNLADDTQAKK